MRSSDDGGSAPVILPIKRNVTEAAHGQELRALGQLLAVHPAATGAESKIPRTRVGVPCDGFCAIAGWCATNRMRTRIPHCLA